MNAPHKYCQHAACRIDTAAELAYLGARLLRRDLRVLVGAVNDYTVRCRKQPRKGAVIAPFPK